ncbi:MAG: hypothetical protein ACRD09_12040, partial [Vicinamibacterales bacterium]
MRIAVTAAAAVLLAAAIACAPALRSTASAPPTPADMAELWQEPADLESRDLLHGPGGKAGVPSPDVAWRFQSADTTGYSRGYDVTGPDGGEWDVKMGPEAQTEIVASRLLWAVGYHQPPTYFVTRWRLAGAPGVDESVPQASARFRPDVPGMKNTGDWSWYENPFVGTRPYHGLLVLNMLMSNWDLKGTNNKLYESVAAGEAEPRRWFVVRDVGATFGKSRGYFPGTRNNPRDYERQKFIVGVQNARVLFAYGGRHRGLLEPIGPTDVVWICERLTRLSDRQWDDAFRAAGYAEAQ